MTAVLNASLAPVRNDSDILPAYRGTPVADLLRFQNLGAGPASTPARYERPAILIATCLEQSAPLRIPQFAAPRAVLRPPLALPAFWVTVAGLARALLGLSVASFQKAITVQELTPAGLATIGPCAMTLATAEGLDAHARAVAIRLEDRDRVPGAVAA